MRYGQNTVYTFFFSPLFLSFFDFFGFEKRTLNIVPISKGEPMRIIYRMRGLLGDATEEFIESLDSTTGM